jgi:thioredoxin reductase (NADPH)
VAVVGGGDTAMEEAQTLTKFAKKVYIIHRRDSFRASQIMQQRILNHEKIEVIWNNQVEEVTGSLKVEGIRLKNDYKGQHLLPVDGLFLAIGHKPDTSLFENKVELDQKGYILTSAQKAIQIALGIDEKSTKSHFHYHFQTMTSVEGVFAAGDCVDHIYKQASTAAGLGVGAALDTERWLFEMNL